jgi:2-polyprenyl-3-methyl-5-hydroxy-6-metoxy-1,4-benzoquinol methylase
MPARAYHEELWENVPEGLEPVCFGPRLSFVLARVAPGERVLDMGCGEGRFTEAIADAGAQVTGADVAAEPLRRARARRPDLELSLIEPEGPWPYEDASFDVVWAGEVIEHVADTGRWLSELRRVLRPAGALLLSTPDHGRLAMLAIALSRGRFAAHFDPRSDHLRFYSRGTLDVLLADMRFEDIRIERAGGPLGARRLLLTSARRARW